MNIETFLHKRFTKKLDISRIKKYCAHLRMDKVRANDKGQKILRVSCVQRKIRLVRNVEEYIDMMYGFVRQAAQNNSEVVIFPEYNFFDLFGLIPGLRMLSKYLSKSASPKNKSTGASETGGGYALISSVFNAISKPVEKCLLEIMSALAEGFGIYIYTGSYILRERGAIYNVGSLFGPDGRCMGTQKKLHLTHDEEKMGIRRGDQLNVYAINDIRIAFPICMDATYFETFRILKQYRADVVLLPIANNEEYSRWRALRGLWPRVQESYVYGVKSSINGWVAGMHFTGKAGIFAPIEMTPEKDGVVAIAPHPEGDVVISGMLDIEQLYTARADAQYFGDTNIEFETDYEKIY